MVTPTERILKDVSHAAEDIAARSKKFYSETVDRLPEGSEEYLPYALGGIVLAAGAFFLGRSFGSKKPGEIDIKKSAYRLARLWLIARMVD